MVNAQNKSHCSETMEKAKTIFRNLPYLNQKYKNGLNNESISKVANSRLGWCKSGGMNVVNYILNLKLLETKIKHEVLSKKSWNISFRAVYEGMYGVNKRKIIFRNYCPTLFFKI